MACSRGVGPFSGFNELTGYYNHNIGGMECNCKFNNLFFVVWCLIEFKHYSMHLHLICIIAYQEAKVSMEFGFCWPIEFDDVT